MSTAALASSNSSRNVLYIVYDDLRPDLSAYDVSYMHTPNLEKLAKTGTLFERAYCQEAVCSPSRMSFTTGRRPNSTKTWNFIDHFRNAECPISNRLLAQGRPMAGGGLDVGGAAQCCTACTAAEGCAGFSYIVNAGCVDAGCKGNCTLLSSIDSWAACEPDPNPTESQRACSSGTRGAFPQWTPLPAHFKNSGYLTLGVGKYYHPGGFSIGADGGAGSDAAHPGGTGSPPLADKGPSWTAAGPNGTLQFPDQRPLIAKWGKLHEGEYGPFGNFGYLNPDDEVCFQDGSASGDCAPPPLPLRPLWLPGHASAVAPHLAWPV